MPHLDANTEETVARHRPRGTKWRVTQLGAVKGAFPQFLSFSLHWVLPLLQTYLT